MRILVTGGAGFIGSHITDAYIRLGHELYIVDNLSSGKRENINKGAKFFELDIRDKLVCELINDEKIDVINHQAAQIDVRKSVENPANDAGINIIGLLNILQCSVKASVKKVIFASSGGTIYGECGSNPPDENSMPNPLSPYGISKLASEFYLKFFSLAHSLKYTVLRYANVYGPRQDPFGEAGVVAIFSNKLLKGENVYIYGDGAQMRDYVFVEDVVEANVKALYSGDNDVFNIGTGEAVSVNELFTAMKKSGGFASGCEFKPGRTGELFKSFLNNSKAEKILGWNPKFLLNTGLPKTLDYFKLKAAK